MPAVLVRDPPSAAGSSEPRGAALMEPQRILRPWAPEPASPGRPRPGQFPAAPRPPPGPQPRSREPHSPAGASFPSVPQPPLSGKRGRAGAAESEPTKFRSFLGLVTPIPGALVSFVRSFPGPAGFACRRSNFGASPGPPALTSLPGFSGRSPRFGPGSAWFVPLGLGRRPGRVAACWRGLWLRGGPRFRMRARLCPCSPGAGGTPEL